jgi:hypothetical protein
MNPNQSNNFLANPEPDGCHPCNAERCENHVLDCDLTSSLGNKGRHLVTRPMSVTWFMFLLFLTAGYGAGWASATRELKFPASGAAVVVGDQHTYVSALPRLGANRFTGPYSHGSNF